MEKTEETITEILAILQDWGCLDHLSPRDVERISQTLWSIPQFAKEELINQIKNL